MLRHTSRVLSPRRHIDRSSGIKNVASPGRRTAVRLDKHTRLIVKRFEQQRAGAREIAIAWRLSWNLSERQRAQPS